MPSPNPGILRAKILSLSWKINSCKNRRFGMEKVGLGSWPLILPTWTWVLATPLASQIALAKFIGVSASPPLDTYAFTLFLTMAAYYGYFFAPLSFKKVFLLTKYVFQENRLKSKDQIGKGARRRKLDLFGLISSPWPPPSQEKSNPCLKINSQSKKKLWHLQSPPSPLPPN